MTNNSSPVPLSNPYGKSKKAFTEPYLLSCYVEAHDFHFLRTLFPHFRGLTDILLSSFFHALIYELKRIHAESPIAPALYADDPAIRILADTLCAYTTPTRGLLGPSSRRPTGETGLRDDGPRTCIVCQNDGGEEGQCGSTQSGTSGRVRPLETEEDEDEDSELDSFPDGSATEGLARLIRMLQSERDLSL